VESAVAVGDGVDDIVVVRKVIPGLVGRDPGRGDDRCKAAVRRASAAGITVERREPRCDVDAEPGLPE
jgi:hypothetical protein